MKQPWTPGMWQVVASEGKFLVMYRGGDGCDPIAEVEDGADARLIAAAPELAVTCHDALVVLKLLAVKAGDVPDWNKGGVGYEMCELLKEKLRKVGAL